MSHEPRIPKAVRDQAAASDALLKKTRIEMGLDQPDPDVLAEDEPDPDAPPVLDPPTDPIEDEPAPDAITPPATPPAGSPDLAAEVASLKAELDRERHRYSVLQGMQRANQTTIEDLEDTVARLTTRLANRGGGDPGAAPLTPSVATPAAAPTDEADAAIVGEEALAVLKRVAETQARAILAPIQQRTAESEGQEAFQAFVSAVPDWEKVEGHANWRAYLDSPHPLTGHPIGAHFVDARSRNDWRTCANVYNEFKKSNGLTAAPAAAAAAKPPVKTLEQRVAPSGASTAAKPVPAATSKKIWSTSEATKEYTRVAVGRSRARGKELEDLIALERELDLAGKEGRIRG